jgi:HTH-like domain
LPWSGGRLGQTRSLPTTPTPGFALTDHVVEVPLDYSTFRAGLTTGASGTSSCRPISSSGSPRVRAELTLGLGERVNRKRAERLMRQAGLRNASAAASSATPRSPKGLVRAATTRAHSSW